MGIGPAYSSKMLRNGIRVGDLRDFNDFCEKLKAQVDFYKNNYPDLEVDLEKEIEFYRNIRHEILEMVVDSIEYLNHEYISGRRILVEGANATMLDIDFGTYPYVTSSNPSTGGVCTGLGIPPKMVGDVYGVVKAYTTRVRDGPFPTELTDDLGAWIQKEGREFGVTTGRPRRCGWLDIPLLKFTSQLNGYTALCLTKTDILDKLDEVKIGVAYVKDGKKLDHYPSGIFQFEGVSVEYLTMPGWKTSIADCRSFDELPVNCKNYILKAQELLGLPFKWVGVGPSRDAMILRPEI